MREKDKIESCGIIKQKLKQIFVEWKLFIYSLCSFNHKIVLFHLCNRSATENSVIVGGVNQKILV